MSNLSETTQPIFVTYEEAAAMLRYCKRTIGRLVKIGKLITYGEGRGRRILYTSVLALCDALKEHN